MSSQLATGDICELRNQLPDVRSCMMVPIQRAVYHDTQVGPSDNNRTAEARWYVKNSALWIQV